MVDLFCHIIFSLFLLLFVLFPIAIFYFKLTFLLLYWVVFFIIFSFKYSFVLVFGVLENFSMDSLQLFYYYSNLFVCYYF